MSQDQSSNKRIAKNTIYMYVRLFATMFIGLYTSRVVLQVLGISDYGLFSVVGGIITMFTFICDSFAGASSRFLNAEMGKTNGNINKVFCVTFFLHVVLSSIIFLLAETVGMWYVLNNLVVSPGKLHDAIFVFQVSIFITCIGIISSPFSSLFIAHERFKFISLLDITNTIFRFVAVLLLQLYDGDYALRLYSLIMCLTTTNTFGVYYYFSRKDWPQIIRLRIFKGWSNYKEIITFGNWNILRTLSFMARASGSDLILNQFFGTAMNGAFAISKSVNSYVMQFSTNFDGASGPQIIQSYAAGQNERYTYLVNKMGRFNILLFMTVFFPLYIELEFILHLWLGEVPEYAVLLTRLNLILAAVSLTSGGLVQLIKASGKIKWFMIELSFFFCSCIPIGWYLFHEGFPVYSMLVLFIIADVLQRTFQLVLLKVILKFNVFLYIREAYLRPTFIILIMCTLMMIYWHFDIENTVIKVVAIIVCAIINVSLIYSIGLTQGERRKTISFILNKLHINKLFF